MLLNFEINLLLSLSNRFLSNRLFLKVIAVYFYLTIDACIFLAISNNLTNVLRDESHVSWRGSHAFTDFVSCERDLPEEESTTSTIHGFKLWCVICYPRNKFHNRTSQYTTVREATLCHRILSLCTKRRAFGREFNIAWELLMGLAGGLRRTGRRPCTR